MLGPKYGCTGFALLVTMANPGSPTERFRRSDFLPPTGSCSEHGPRSNAEKVMFCHPLARCRSPRPVGALM